METYLTDDQKLKVISAVSGVVLRRPFPRYFATMSQMALNEFVARNKHLIFRDSMTPELTVKFINTVAVHVFRTLEEAE